MVASRNLMRAINRFAILHAVRDAGAIPRVEIARTTGLSQATVTGITAELIREGMLLEQNNGKSAGGRRPVPLALNPQGAYTVGVHPAVDRICVVLMDLQAAIINSHVVHLEPRDLDLQSVIEKLIQGVQTCLWEADFSRNQISGMGVAVPGLVDSQSGLVRYIPNYQWRDVKLAELLNQRIGIPVYIENSANALVIFEQWFGIGRGTDSFLLVTTGHGIGMGMVVNGRIYRGIQGFAGEFGHTVIDPNGPLCRCGERGCLEAISGNNAIIREAGKAAREGRWVPRQPDTFGIEEVLAAARAGNPALGEIYGRAGRTLGMGINNLRKLFDPEKIIITGRGVLAGDLMFKPMQETLDKEISLTGDSRTSLFVQNWQATDYARGAGALVLQEVYESPANRVVPLI